MSIFDDLKDRCRVFEHPLDQLVFTEYADERLIRITRDINTYTMTTAFMVDGTAMCSVDCASGAPEDIFSKLAMRMR